MKYTNKNSGFTIVETLIAIVIFSFSVAGMVVVASGGIKDLTLGRNRLVANYFAQEGIELVRNVRDTYLMDPTNTWANFRSTLLAACATGCAIDYSKITGSPQVFLAPPLLQTCPTVITGACVIKEDTLTGAYGPLVGGSDTVFTRAIVFTSSNSDEMGVRVVVKWQHGLSQQSVSVGESIYHWE